MGAGSERSNLVLVGSTPMVNFTQEPIYINDLRQKNIRTHRPRSMQDIMVILGRRFYEAVKTWGEVQLSPIIELIAK
jgi:hypothetical protein